MTWDPLAEMHLLLREYGWKPEEAPDPGTVVDDAISGWIWNKRGQKVYFVTVRRPRRLPLWSLSRSHYPYEVLVNRSRSVVALRQRLQEVAHQKQDGQS